MEDLIDDDFGSIYADVEVQATNAINSLSNFGKLNTGEEENSNIVNCTTKERVNSFVSVSDSKQLNSDSEKLCNLEADGSDSEDDLNIVLNDDVVAERNGDRDGFVHEDEVGIYGVKRCCGKNLLDTNANYFVERMDGLNRGSNFEQYKVSESAGMVYSASSSKSARDDMEDNRCKQQNISKTSQVANMRGKVNSVIPQGGCSFSLPWYRTIFDVNIDAFEEKRWRYHGVDISDFFNFGFDEDSWKQYCISLEQCRQYSYFHSTFPNHGSSELFQPKGRAIQVEDSTFERRPTMDLRRARTWDSDVVIQISPGSGEEAFHHTDDNQHEVSKRRDLNEADIKDVQYSGSANNDEMPAKSPKNIQSSSTNRCSMSLSESSEMPSVPDNHNRDQKSGDNNKVNAQVSDEIAEKMEPIEKVEEENGRNTCKSDPFVVETELSVGERSHFSLTLSCSESDFDASRDSWYGNSEVSSSPSRGLSPGTMLHEPVADNWKCSENSDSVRKLANNQHYSRNRCSTWEGKRHQNQRVHRLPEGKIHPPTDSDASPMSRDRLLLINRRRCSGRSHDFGYDDKENLTCDGQRDFLGFGVERFSDNHVQDVCSKHPYRKHHQKFREEMKPQERRMWHEGNLHERNFRSEDRDDWHRDGHYGGRGLSPKVFIPPTYRESRRLVSKSNNFEETNFHWAKGNKFVSEKKTNLDGCSPDHEILDELMLRKYGRRRSIPVNSQKQDYLDEKHGSHVPFIEREANLYGGRDRCGYSSTMELENSWCLETEDEHWDSDKQHLSCWFHGESDEVNEERLRESISPRSSMLDPSITDRYWRRRRAVSGDKCVDNHWLDNYDHIDNAEDAMIYMDELARRRRKYNWQSGILHRTQDESFLSYQDDGFYTKRSSFSYEKSFRHERIHAKYRSTNCWMVIDDMQLEQHRSKMFKGESNYEFQNDRFQNRKRNMMKRYEHERTAWRCSDPVDLICGEGKSSGRRSTAESSMSRCKFRRMDLKYTKHHETVKDCNGIQSRKATQIGSSKTYGRQDDHKFLGKFHVRQHEENLDIEEGQIVAEKPLAEDRLEKKRASRKVAPFCNIKKKFFHSQNVSGENETEKAYDEQRILDTLAKMERRRERFKDSVALEKEQPDKILKPPIKILKPQVDLITDKLETKQDRPARKRQWGGGS